MPVPESLVRPVRFRPVRLHRTEPGTGLARTGGARLFSGPPEDPDPFGLPELGLLLPEHLGRVDVHALEDELVVDVVLARAPALDGAALALVDRAQGPVEDHVGAKLLAEGAHHVLAHPPGLLLEAHLLLDLRLAG